MCYALLPWAFNLQRNQKKKQLSSGSSNEGSVGTYIAGLFYSIQLSVKQYCLTNDVCRRNPKILGSYFDTEYDSVTTCACCDVCSTITCLCDVCQY